MACYNGITCLIELGGKFSRSSRSKTYNSKHLQDALIETLNSEEVQLDYGVPIIVDVLSLRKFVNSNGYLCFRHDDKELGHFQELESFCRKEKIPYRRWSDINSEYDQEDVRWLPGMKAPFECSLDRDGVEIVEVDKVREAFELLKSDIAEKQMLGMGYLQKICQKPPEIPKFEFAD